MERNRVELRQAQGSAGFDLVRVFAERDGGEERVSGFGQGEWASGILEAQRECRRLGWGEFRDANGVAFEAEPGDRDQVREEGGEYLVLPMWEEDIRASLDAMAFGLAQGDRQPRAALLKLAGALRHYDPDGRVQELMLSAVEDLRSAAALEYEEPEIAQDCARAAADHLAVASERAGAEELIRKHWDELPDMHYRGIIALGQKNGFDGGRRYGVLKLALDEVRGIDMDERRKQWLEHSKPTLVRDADDRGLAEVVSIGRGREREIER